MIGPITTRQSSHRHRFAHSANHQHGWHRRISARSPRHQHRWYLGFCSTTGPSVGFLPHRRRPYRVSGTGAGNVGLRNFGAGNWLHPSMAWAIGPTEFRRKVCWRTWATPFRAFNTSTLDLRRPGSARNTVPTRPACSRQHRQPDNSASQTRAASTRASGTQAASTSASLIPATQPGHRQPRRPQLRRGRAGRHRQHRDLRYRLANLSSYNIGLANLRRQLRFGNAGSYKYRLRELRQSWALPPAATNIGFKNTGNNKYRRRAHRQRPDRDRQPQLGQQQHRAVQPGSGNIGFFFNRAPATSAS